MLAELAKAALVISPRAVNNDNNLVFILFFRVNRGSEMFTHVSKGVDAKNPHSEIAPCGKFGFSQEKCYCSKAEAKSGEN